MGLSGDILKGNKSASAPIRGTKTSSFAATIKNITHIDGSRRTVT